MKLRADALLVTRGLAPSRAQAQALIMAGHVTVGERRIDKPGALLPEDAALAVAARPRFVSRGGDKLESAIVALSVEVAGKICLDVGASTGGFTDCLLQNGAARVHAVDVGHGQFDWKLRNDPRVVVYENLNARHLTPEHIGESVDLAVCDVSFISVTLILPAVVPLLNAGGEMIVLVKPQFEAGREQVGKGGIIRDPAVQRAACDRVAAAAAELGFATAIIESPILGAEGNREFLLHARR